jgi:hypothetical protein
MNCQQASNLLESYADGEVTEAQAAVLSAHLAACPACRTEYSTLLSIRNTLGTYPRIEASPDFDIRVLDAVLSRAAQPETFFDRLDLFFARPLYKLLGSTALGLFLALLTVAAVLLPQSRNGSTPTLPPGAQSTTVARDVYRADNFYAAGLLPNATYADIARDLYPLEPTPPRRKERRGSSWDAATSELSYSSQSGSLC